MEGAITLGATVPAPTVPRKMVTIPLDAMSHHVCILGTTGTGKSACAAVFAYELGARGVATTIFDRTGEYAAMMGKFEWTKVYKSGESLATALFQREADKPLSLQVEGWVSLLNHYTTVSYRATLSPLQQRVLREILTRYYAGTSETLTISKLIGKLEQYEERVRSRGGWEESVEALISRLVPLTVDVVGKTLDRPYTTLKLNALFEPVTSVLDLSSLGADAAKNLVSQLILKMVYEKMRRLPMTGDLRIVMIVDEAQHLAPNSDYVGIPELCALELRKYGFSLVMLATRPSLISPNVLSNCGTFISHMLTSDRDVRMAAEHCLVGGDSQFLRDTIRTLEVGNAVVQVNYPRPLKKEVCKVGLSNQRQALGLVRENPPELLVSS